MKNIAIFASGSGTNAENIIKHFHTSDNVKVKLVLTNNPTAGVLERCKTLNVDTLIFNRSTLYHTDEVLHQLIRYQIDFVVLAGFLWLMPTYILDHFPQKVVNIHPALLPKYGGKGMFGDKVHQAVVQAGEKESGITIHYVNEHYDEGDIIFQAKCPVEPTDTPDDVAAKVHQLEYTFFPKVIKDVLVKLHE